MMMSLGTGILKWTPLLVQVQLQNNLLPLQLQYSSPSLAISSPRHSISASLNSQIAEEEEEEQEEVTGRERRRLRNQSRSSSSSNNWREQLEERLLKKPKNKKKAASWTEQLNLDNLSLLGPQWWVVKVSRPSAHYTADQIARSLSRNFPLLDFKVYFPAVHVKRKLKNGSYSDKLNPMFPGCVFLYCVLNREIHDFVREVIGIGGFVGSKVGNTKRQINRPKPVSIDEMEEIFKQVKEEQEKADRAFEKEQQKEGIFSGKELNGNTYSVSEEVLKTTKVKTERRYKKSLNYDENLFTEEGHTSLVPGCSVQVLSGPFAEFGGHLEQLDHLKGKATVKLTLFGKEISVDLDIDQTAAETK